MNRNLIILAWSGALGLLMLGGCATCCGEPTIDLAKVKITLRQPEDVLVKVGGKATFSTGARVNVRLPDQLGLPTFQWFRDCDPLKGENKSNLEIAPVTKDKVGVYHCVIQIAGETLFTTQVTLQCYEAKKESLFSLRSFR